MLKNDSGMATEVIGSFLMAVADTLAHLHQVCDHFSEVVVDDLNQCGGNATYRLKDLRNAYGAAQDILSEEPRTLLGMGFAADPEAFAEPALLWWYAAPSGSDLRALRVRLQPENLTYYDYTGSQWWRRAGSGDTLNMTGPYIDHGGTNAHIVTVSRVVSFGGKTVGVTAADILVGTLQAMWQKDLGRLSRPSSLVDEEGVVVVTNSGKLMGSTLRLDVPSPRVPVPGTNWLLVSGEQG